MSICVGRSTLAGGALAPAERMRWSLLSPPPDRTPELRSTNISDGKINAYRNVYPAKEAIMQVAKWGNSLAVRLPAAVVQALELKEGEEIELHVVGERTLEVARKAQPVELLARLRRLRGRLPADFRFDRLEANEEDRNP